MQHIFLIHTPYQMMTATQMLQLPELQNQPIIWCAQGALPLPSPLPDNVSVITLHSVPFWKISSALHKQTEDNAQRVQECITGPCTIYLSDLHWFTNNRIFFDAVLRTTAHFAIYDEGIGIYMDQRITPKQWAKDTLKAVVGCAGLGPSVRAPYTGNFMGTDHPRIQSIYAFQPTLVQSQQKQLVTIPPITTTQAALDPQKTLFLDQHYWFKTKGGEERWQSFFAKALDYLRTLDGEVCVKMHHTARDKERHAYAEAGFTLLDESRSAELIIEEYGFGNVVSFCSSALFNIGNMYPACTVRSILLKEMLDCDYITAELYAEFTRLYRAAAVDIV